MKYNYPFTYRQAIKCIIYCIVFLILFTMQQTSSNFNRVYFQFYGYIFLIGIFVYKYFLFQRKVKEKIYISVNATKCLKMFGNLIVYLAGIVFIGILIIIKDRRAWDEYLLMWQFGLLFILYLIAIFYPFIVVFGKKSYISGSFGMCYGEIREIVDVKTYDIMGTEIKKCEIVTKNGKKCKERFMIDEYNFLCSLCDIGENMIKRMGVLCDRRR